MAVLEISCVTRLNSNNPAHQIVEMGSGNDNNNDNKNGDNGRDLRHSQTQRHGGLGGSV